MSNFLLFIFGPCEVFRDIVGIGDCSYPSTARWVLAVVLFIGIVVLLYVVFNGGIKAAKPITKWMHRAAERNFSEYPDGDLLIIGTFICALVLIFTLILEGVAGLGVWTLILCSAIYIILFVVRIGKRQQETDPDRDLPAEVRRMSLAELREEVERRDLRKRIREQMGTEGRDMFKTAKTLHDINEEERHLATQFPKLKRDIEIMAEIRKIQIKEKL